VTESVNVAQASQEDAASATQVSSGPVTLAARLTGWGLFGGVASGFLASWLGYHPLVQIAGNLGFVLAGVGALTLFAIFLRRPRVRAVWRLGAVLGIPLEVAALVTGVAPYLLPLPGPLDPGTLDVLVSVRMTMLLLGVLLGVLLGGDFLRHLVKGPRVDAGVGEAGR